MTPSKDEKRAMIQAKRGSLETEQYSAELDLKTAKAGDNEDLVKGPQERLDGINKQLEVLEKEEAKLD
jgi:hypothetical protein